jgi:signal transduction histidine kinase
VRLTLKFGLLLTALTLAVMGITLAFLYTEERSHLAGQAAAQRREAVEKLARVCGDSILEDNELSRLTYLKAFLAAAPPGHVVEAALLGADGRVLMHSDFLRGDFSLQGKPAPPALGAGRRLEPVAREVAVGGRRAGTAVVVYDAASVEAALAALQREALWRFARVSVWAPALSLALAWLLARAIVRPVRELGEGARRIGRGDLRHRVPAGRADELGDLAREFNAMGARLTELDELKESFLSRVTHDLRNPLSAMLGYVELILLGMQGPLAESQRQSLEVVTRNGRYLAELINNILDMSKIEAGKMELALDAVPLRALADDVTELARGMAREYGVELVEPNIPPTARLRGDAQALKRVLLNLVFNALKFTPKGGHVGIEWARTPDGRDRVSVFDTGIGIPADKLKTLFQKFSQVAEAQNKVREARGTGLGLAICKDIVEAHGGRIGVESAPGEGSSFFFILPPVPAPPPAAALEEAQRHG